MEIFHLQHEAQHDEDSRYEQFAIDVMTGLCSKPKRLSAKYFYDDRGSEIFQQITQHSDYYPTRKEFEILESIQNRLPENFSESEIDIIELGVGDGHKSRLIIEGFLNKGTKVNFYPIDISAKAMNLLEENLPKNSDLTVNGVVGEYFEGLRFVRKRSTNRQLVLFLGSNIGNFDKVQNQAFLRQLWHCLDCGDFALIGFDLKKDIGTMMKAYNDSAGHTREFNLNLLTRINRELGADFDTQQFQHFGVYNPILGAMESYLIAKQDLKVSIKELERTFVFKAYEPIHLEYSLKFHPNDIDDLSKLLRFEVMEHFTDGDGWFTDSLWRVVKNRPH